MSKKRSKAYKPRAATVPMLFVLSRVPDRYPYKAAELYGQLIAFIESPSFTTSKNLSHELAAIAGGMSYMHKGVGLKYLRDPGSIAIVSAIFCMNAIGARFERTGAIAVTEQDKATLRGAAARLDEALRTMPLACYLRGEEEADKWLVESKEPQLEVA
jgi:hypothetical protein